MTNAIAIAEAAHKRQGQLSGVPTGFRDLDGKLGGLHGSDLLILAGRPSMGKTALATNIAFNAARRHRTETGEDSGTRTVDGAMVGFFSLEMSREQLATRILAEQTRIPSDKIRRGLVAGDKFPELIRAAGELQRLPMYIDDTPALTISAMRTRARRLKRQVGLGLIVIDYLQLIAPNPGVRYDSRVQELSEITRGLKALAKELHVPVLALSQLSRAVEQREDKRPQLADLRESGTIEQDADVVMFIFREEYYVQRQQPNAHATDRDGIDRYEKWQRRLEAVANKAEVMIAKQRHGPTGNVPLHFNAALTAFRDAETTHAGTD
jgi:replicative DNA helicase